MAQGSEQSAELIGSSADTPTYKPGPELYSQIKTAGMLCVRRIKFNTAHYSNHSWGTAVDLYFGPGVVPQGKHLTQRGFLDIYETFNRHGWCWGVGLSSGFVDTMHFGLLDETVRAIDKTPLSPNVLSAAADYITRWATTLFSKKVELSAIIWPIVAPPTRGKRHVRDEMRFAILFTTCAILATGCTDLTPVQNFAATGSAISANEPVISGWPNSYDRVTALAGSEAVRRYAPDAKESFIDETKQVTVDAKLGTGAAQLLGLYLEALAQLAGGSVTDVSKQASSIQSSIKTLGVTSRDVTAATDALAFLLNGWQNKAIGDIIKQANGPVQRITSYLASVADNVRIANNEAMIASNQYLSIVGARSGNVYTLALAQRAMNEDDIYYKAQMNKAAAAQLAFTKIGADHAVLARNVDSLSGARATLEADEPVLQGALAAIFK